MKKNFILILTILSISLLSNCSSKGEFIYDKSDYNSLVPSWMQIGATDESEKVEETKDEDTDATWWNPFSWF